MHEVLVNRLGGLSLPRKSVVRLTDRPDMTLDVHRGRKTTMQQQQPCNNTFCHQTVLHLMEHLSEVVPYLLHNMKNLSRGLFNKHFHGEFHLKLFFLINDF